MARCGSTARVAPARRPEWSLNERPSGTHSLIGQWASNSSPARAPSGEGDRSAHHSGSGASSWAREMQNPTTQARGKRRLAARDSRHVFMRTSGRVRGPRRGCSGMCLLALAPWLVGSPARSGSRAGLLLLLQLFRAMPAWPHEAVHRVCAMVVIGSGLAIESLTTWLLPAACRVDGLGSWCRRGRW